MTLQTQLERGAGRAVNATAAMHEEARRKMQDVAGHAAKRGTEAGKTVSESQREMLGHLTEAMTGTFEKFRDAMQDFAGMARKRADTVAEGTAEMNNAAAAEARKAARRPAAEAKRAKAAAGA